ncbi:hypothetical protein Sinac_2942 [Singulisphaera acidiphila DSM 18658]|uniref:Uncharacterized protein n=1 Tax=Singulisphaera acidiphila (strain ATCC BAA-1392 / DSM 18658 / VKM B-2454 / MOB10) TaxID=886293 RepID=L0DEW7_SINAD|nr:hypothetical protein Sinac_2942 [Singulisphaera acidiphila DSM 18658]
MSKGEAGGSIQVGVEPTAGAIDEKFLSWSQAIGGAVSPLSSSHAISSGKPKRRPSDEWIERFCCRSASTKEPATTRRVDVACWSPQRVGTSFCAATFPAVTACCPGLRSQISTARPIACSGDLGKTGLHAAFCLEHAPGSPGPSATGTLDEIRAPGPISGSAGATASRSPSRASLLRNGESCMRLCPVAHEHRNTKAGEGSGNHLRISN